MKTGISERLDTSGKSEWKWFVQSVKSEWSFCAVKQRKGIGIFRERATSKEDILKWVMYLYGHYLKFLYQYGILD